MISRFLRLCFQDQPLPISFSLQKICWLCAKFLFWLCRPTTKMCPILDEKCPILTNNISYCSDFFGWKKYIFCCISWELFTFLKLGRQWEISLFCHISPEVFIFLSFGIWCREYLPSSGNFIWMWFFMESFDIYFIESLEGIWYFLKLPYSSIWSR